jgi:hypothetical protein
MLPAGSNFAGPAFALRASAGKLAATSTFYNLTLPAWPDFEGPAFALRASAGRLSVFRQPVPAGFLETLPAPSNHIIPAGNAKETRQAPAVAFIRIIQSANTGEIRPGR